MRRGRASRGRSLRSRRSFGSTGIAVADPAGPQCSEPGPGLEPGGATVGRPECDKRATDQILGGDHPNPALIIGKTAVEAVVAVVAHQEDPAGRHNGGWKI